MFGYRSKDMPKELAAIPVPRAAFEADDTCSLAAAVVAFVNRAVNEALYRKGELPPAAMQAFLVDFYIAEASGPGHAAFVADSGWQAPIVAEVRAGLAAIGDPAAKALFEDLVALVGDEPDMVPTQAYAELDRRFATEIGERLAFAETKWLRSLECLLVLEKEEYDAILEGLTGLNPRLEQRSQADEKRAFDAALTARYRDPLAQACEFLCMSAGEPIVYAKWTEKAPTVSPEGIRGTSVRFFGQDERRGEVLLFPHYAALMMADDIRARPPVAINLVQEHVRRMTGEYLPADLFG